MLNAKISINVEEYIKIVCKLGFTEVKKMMDYKKPKCDCNTFLHAFRSEYWKVARAITNNGELSDKTIKVNTSFDDSDYKIKLICPKCGRTYEADYDDKDRIIRGKIIQ